MSTRQQDVTELYYNEFLERLVFAPPEVAIKHDRIHRALGAETWGEFSALMPEDELNELIQAVGDGVQWRNETFPHRADFEKDDDEEIFSLPEDSDPVDVAHWCPGYESGDYPDWLAARQGEWLPDDLLKQYGTRALSAASGWFWEIDPFHEEPLVEALMARGIRVERRDDLSFY